MLLKWASKLGHHWKLRVAYSGPNLYLHRCWCIFNLTVENKIQGNFNQITKIFIQDNAFENILYKLATVLSRPRCVYHKHRADTGWHARSDVLFSSMRRCAKIKEIFCFLKYTCLLCLDSSLQANIPWLKLKVPLKPKENGGYRVNESYHGWLLQSDGYWLIA